MTYGMLRKRVCALLQIDISTPPAKGSLLALCDTMLPMTVNAAAQRAALILKCCQKEAVLRFTAGDGCSKAVLPPDFLSAKALAVGKRIYGGEHMEASGGRLTLFLCGVTEGRLSYYAYPTVDTADADAPLPFDDTVADTVAYGAAAELCHAVYPTDMKLYMRLATEFDGRLAAGAPRSGERGVANGFYSGRGGRR